MRFETNFSAFSETLETKNLRDVSAVLPERERGQSLHPEGKGIKIKHLFHINFAVSITVSIKAAHSDSDRINNKLIFLLISASVF